MNSLIYDEQAILDYLAWLPDLEENEAYYLCLFCRKKYRPDVIATNDKTQLARKGKSSKEYVMDTLLKWDMIDWGYPVDSLVAYLHPNPRCQVKAMRHLIKTGIDLVFNKAKGYSTPAQAMSSLQRSASRKPIMTFDLDGDTFKYNALNEIFNGGANECVNIIETRGGHHLLVEPKKATAINRAWYNRIVEYGGESLDQKGDLMSPIPGTLQGGHKVKILDYVR